MGKVVGGMAVSMDGFVSDKNGGVERLYPDLAELGQTEWLQNAIRTTGAVVMGRQAYEMGQGDFTGYEYQVPIFVITHQKPEQPAKGENDNLRLTFVTEGVESAFRQAKAAAGDKDVTVVGGVSTLQQCLKAGLIDEFELGVVPVFLGEGLRLFEGTNFQDVQLEKIRAVDLPRGRTQIVYRVIK